MTQQEFETTAKEMRPLMYDVGLRYFHSQRRCGGCGTGVITSAVEILRKDGCEQKHQGIGNKGCKELLHKHET